MVRRGHEAGASRSEVLLHAAAVSILLCASSARAQDDALDTLLADQGEAAAEGRSAAGTPADRNGTQASDDDSSSAHSDVYATIPTGTASAPADTLPAPRASRQIEEIVVTAQKREESLQNVPIAISAFSGERLEAAGAETTKNLAQLTPGLTVTELAGYTFIYLRGVGSDAFIASADPSVATYVDGVYVPIGHGFAQELGNVERVEVLKGPQGTLFGRNSTGGAINVTTKKPGHAFESSLSGSYADFDTYSAKAYVSIPLADSLALSVSGLLRGSQSYYERAGPRADRGIDDDAIRGFRVRTRWNPTETTELLLTGQRVDITAPGSLVSANRRPSMLGTALGIRPTEEDFVTEADTDSLNQAYQTSIYGQFTWELPWLDIKLLGNDLLNDATALQTDFDGSSQPLVSFFSPHEFTDIRTAELQFLSNDGSWGSGWLTWVAGVFHLESNAGFDPVVLQAANSIVQLPTGQLIDLIPQGLRNLLPPVPLPTALDIYLEGLLETESTSGFAQATAALTDWFSLTLGGRYQRETRKQTRSTVNLLNSQGGLTTLISYVPQASTVSNFSPKVSFDLRPWDETLLYLSWAKGFKSHTYNIINIYTAPEFIKPEELTSYELGIKSSFIDNTLRLNAAVFQNETRDLQSSFISLLAGGAVRLENAGKARSRGAEMDLTWLPMPALNPGLSLTFGAAYLDAVYVSFEDGSGFDEQTGLQQGGQDFSGNRVTRTPEWTFNLGLSQIIETARGALELGVDGYYTEEFFFLPQNGELSLEPGYALLGARIGYRIEDWGLRLTVFGSNLTDERYNIAQFHTDFGRNDTQAPPRTFGLRLNWDF